MFGGGKKVVGLDIGSSQVKAVELRKSGSKLELTRLGVAEVYPGGDQRSYAGSDPFDLKVNAIIEALRNGRITAKHSVSAVSGESVIVRYIQLPDMPEQELRAALRWEAEEYIPFSIDEVNLDSVVLGPSATPGKVDVLLVTARKDLVSEHVQMIRMANLIPLVVDVEGFAFLNCFEATYKPGPDETVCLVHIGAEVTNINVYVGNTSRFSRDIGIAGNSITESIVQRCGVNFAKAEELKAAVGTMPPDIDEGADEEENELISSIRGAVERITGSDLGDDSVEAMAAKAIQNSLSQLISEVRRSIQFFESQGGGATIQRVIIGGGTSRMKNLPQYLQSELDVPVEVFDPLRGISVSKEIDAALLERHREQLGAPIGLALRKVLD